MKILLKKFVISHSENSWKHVVNSIIVHLSTGNGNRGRNKKFVKEELEEDSDGMLDDEIDENDDNAIEEFIGKF